MAEKIIAITNELERPFKHLTDVYGLINLCINIELLKKYLSLQAGYTIPQQEMIGIANNLLSKLN